MDRKMQYGCLAFALLLSVMLVTAGCASIPGPVGKPVPTVTTKTITPSKITTTIPASPVKTLRTLVPVTTAATPAPSAASGLPESRYSVEACPEVNGFVVNPGEICPGVWLDTTETFSCCSQKPVRSTQTNLIPVTARPLVLQVNVTDDPGPIV
jgi:hypothetical protein